MYLYNLFIDKIISRSRDDSFILYDVTFGPGFLGMELMNKVGKISEDGPDFEPMVVIKEFKKDKHNINQCEKCGNIKIGSMIVSVNSIYYFYYRCIIIS